MEQGAMRKVGGAGGGGERKRGRSRSRRRERRGKERKGRRKAFINRDGGSYHYLNLDYAPSLMSRL